MKRAIILFVFSAVLIALLNTSCSKIGELCFDTTKKESIATNEVKTAGASNATKSSKDVDFVANLKAKGINTSNINSVYVVSAITVTIPATAGYTFADFTSAELTISNSSLGSSPISLGTLPANATGLSATFSTPTKVDLKSPLISGTEIIFSFNSVVKKALPASSVDISIPLNACYQVL